MSKKFYAVKNGKRPGIYTQWEGAEGARAQVSGFKGAIYKGFGTEAEAMAFLDASEGREVRDSIGSDEAGKGEIFRSLIVVAACVQKDDIPKLQSMDVKDSKAFGKNTQRLMMTGEALLDIAEYDEVDWEAMEKGLIIESPIIKCAAVMLPNSRFEEIRSESYNLDSIMVDMHIRAINTLQEYTSCYEQIIIDDFFAGMRTGKRKAKYEKLIGAISAGKPSAEIIMEQRADAKYMAVSAASVAAVFLEKLYIKKLSELLLAECGIDEEIPDGPVSPAVRSFIGRLVSSEKGRDFYNRYAKISYVSKE